MALLTAVEPGREGLRAQVFQAETLLPVVEGWLGRAKATGPVDGGGATHAPALQYGDAAIGGHPAHAFLVQAGIGFVFVHPEIWLMIQPAFLHQYDPQTGFGQNFGRGTAARAGANHHHCLLYTSPSPRD